MLTLKPQKVRLPNGLEIYAPRREEALLVYDEVGDYVRHGLQLQAGATIFDVGANIGLFSLWAYQACQHQATLYAFEPIPAIFNLLAANLQTLGDSALKALPYGLSNQAATLNFAYYPNATFASTAYPDQAPQERALTQTLLLRSWDRLPTPLPWLRHLSMPIQRTMASLLARYITQHQPVTCQLRTISQVIAEYGIEQIDFLKIDAEKSELAVLQGIAEGDWSIIQQLFVEVHNRAGRLETIRMLLNQQGFRKVIVEQDPFFAHTDIYAIYAAR